MQRGPSLIMLMLATGVSPIADAVGLGDIHIDSALNEPLAAQIDIYGASQDDLATLAAKVANRDVFEQHGAERPAFLSSTQFRIGVNSQGRPVLNVRSTESFNEPVVTLLVDLSWNNARLIKEYSLLLDPAVYAADQSVQNAPTHEAILTTAGSPESIPPGIIVTPVSATLVEPGFVVAHQIVAHGSLHSMARRAGARTKSQISKMMVALYAANPLAFDGNMNKIHGDAVLTVPSRADVAMITARFARREIRAQRRAWLQEKATSAIVVDPPQSADSTSVLKNRVQSLEQGLNDLHKQLTRDDEQISALSAPAVVAQFVPVTQPAITPVLAAGVLTPYNGTNQVVSFGLAVFALLLATFFWHRKRLPRRGSSQPDEADLIPASSVKELAFEPAKAPIIAQTVLNVAPASSTPSAEKEAQENSTRDLPMLETATYNMVTLDEMDIDTALLKNDLNTVIMENKSRDLDSDLSAYNSASHYVDMPSNLHDRVIPTERRTDIVDILKSAIERDPKRQDLQLKLLETYYSMVTANHRAFMEIARTLARDRDLIKVADWEKILMMGREIASDDVLFEQETVATDLVNCA